MKLYKKFMNIQKKTNEKGEIDMLNDEICRLRDKLNESIKKENISIGLNTKKQAYIESKEGEVFDFSSIDKFSYKDIQNIDENIKREEALNFDYSTLKKSI